MAQGIILNGRITKMHEYTIEELRNLSEDELMALTENFDKKAHEFTKEEVQIILKNMENKYKDIAVEVDRVEDILEVIRYAESYDYELLPQQLEAIKDAFEACDLQDWERCRFALEIFFQYESPENGHMIDISNWSSKHIRRWQTMLWATNLKDKPEGSPARVLFEKISKKMERMLLQ